MNSQYLSLEEELELARKYPHNKQAMEKLVLAYKPLVMKMAQKATNMGGNLEDLRQEAFLAICECLAKFDPERGNRLGTFARTSITGQIFRHIMDMAGPVRVGTNLAEKRAFLRFHRARAAWEAKNQRPLDDEGRAQIAKELGVSIKTLQRAEVKGAAGFSLDEPISSQEESDTRGSLLVDSGPSPEDIVSQHLDRQRVQRALREEILRLPKRERDIILSRFDKRKEFKEIGEQLGITKERVRQIEKRALKRLRDNLEARGFDKQAVLAAM